MEPTFNTSFIPKHTPGQSPEGVLPPEKRVRRRAAYGLGFFVALLMFFFSGLAAIGVFVYTQMVQQRVEQLIADVTDLKNQLRPETIQALIRDDTRLTETKRLLVNHRVLSGFLEELEAVTLQEVQYTSASFMAEEGRSSLVLDGITRDYTRVAGQTSRFEGHGSFPLPVVTALERGEGDVSFSLSSQVDPALVQFGKVIERGVYGAPGVGSSEAAPRTEVTPEVELESESVSVFATSTPSSVTSAEGVATGTTETTASE